MTIRVVIVDDSATMRAILMNRLGKEPDIEVIAAAANAAEGRQMIRELDPDVVTLDVEMPGMNGLDFLAKIMELRPTPVIIVSGATQAGAEATARALALGAVDCYAKSGGIGLDDGGRLARMIREAAKVRFSARAPAARRVAQEARGSLSERPALIAIGSSTGGVEALQTVLGSFPPDCPPTVVVQHINARFAPAVARTLDKSCPPTIMLAQPDMPMKPGHVYLAPGDERHLSIGGGSGGHYHCRLRGGDPVSGHQPSVDVLFHSVAETVGPRAVGILLTGMGADGAQGLLAMARKGAHTIAQDEATCTVFGMPRAAIHLGAAAVVAPLGSIARHAFSKAA
ncbi:MAG: chemotaxis-specific protein-glutamate methyltransferase CheB [Pseudomonadota bacterium]